MKNKTISILGVLLVLLVSFFPLGIGYFEVILTALFILIISRIEFKQDLFNSLGFKRSNFKAKSLLIYAPLTAAFLFACYYFVLVPVVGKLTGQSLDFSNFEELKGDLTATLIVIPLIWVSAAFGEEIIWRGYLMRQFIRWFGSGTLSVTLNIISLGIMFGYMHNYQGITGMIITGIIGMILGYIFYKRDYDLWFNVAVHGFFDTIALLVLYMGWF